MTDSVKICNTCQESKSFSDFHFNRGVPRHECKICRRLTEVVRNKANRNGARARLKPLKRCPIISLVKERKVTKEWRLKNRDRVNAIKREWKKNNPLSVKKTNSLRVARKKEAANLAKYFREEIKAIFEQATTVGIEQDKKLSVDHIIPILNKKVCGLHVPWNLQIITPEENSNKSNKFDGTYDNNGWSKNVGTATIK